MIYSRATATSGFAASPQLKAQWGCIHSAEWSPLFPHRHVVVFSQSAGSHSRRSFIKTGQDGADSGGSTHDAATVM